MGRATHLRWTVLFCLLMAASALAADLVYKPVAVTATVNYGPRPPIRSIDNSGLDFAVPSGAPPISWPGHTSAPDGYMYLSNAVELPWMKFDLGSAYGVNSFHLWNYNEAGGWHLRGINECDVSFSLDDVTYSAPLHMTFTVAPGANGYTGEDYFFAPTTARYVMFQTVSDHGGDAYTGISEVRFGDITPPPPASAWTGNGDADNDGNWSAAANWDNPVGNNDVILPAVVGNGNSGTATRTVTVDAASTIKKLTMESSASPYVSHLVVNDALTIQGPLDDHDSSPSVPGRARVTVNPGGTLTFHEGTFEAFTLDGTGNIVTTGNVTFNHTDNAAYTKDFTGTWTVQSGTLTVTGREGQLQGAHVVVDTGATYQQTGVHFGQGFGSLMGSQVTLEDGSLYAPAGLTNWNFVEPFPCPAPIVLDGGVATYRFAPDGRDNVGAPKTYILGQDGVISGAGGLLFDVYGLWSSAEQVVRLTQTNLYLGATIVDRGTLEVSGQLLNSHVTVRDGATLVATPFNVPAGVTVEPGGTWIGASGKVWVGNGDFNNDGDWSDVLNWFGHELPGPGDIASLPGVTGQGNSATNTRTVTVDVPATIDTLKLNNTLAPYVSRLLINANMIIGTVEEAGAIQRVVIEISPGRQLTLSQLNTTKISLAGGGKLVVDGSVAFGQNGYTGLAYGFTGEVEVVSGTFRADGVANHFQNASRIVVHSGATCQDGSKHFGPGYDLGDEIVLHDNAMLLFDGFSPWNNPQFPSVSAITLAGGMALWRWTPDGTYSDPQTPTEFFLNQQAPITGPGGLTYECWATNPNGLTPTIHLIADNTYLGPTVVAQGNLQVSGSLANSNITIADGATLRGGSGTLVYHLVGDAADLITVLGTLEITDLTLDVRISGAQTLGEYVVADYSAGTLVGSTFFDVLNLPADWSISYGDPQSDPFIRLTAPMVEIPEPASAVLLVSGLAGLVLRRRRCGRAV